MPDEESPARYNGRHASIALTLHVQEGAWRDAIPEIEALVRGSLEGVFNEGDTKKTEVAVVLADDSFVRDLNARFRSKDKPTNVLSFPSAPQSDELGDIVLAFETVSAEARQERKSLAEHTAHLLVHGALHLLGHTHDGDLDAERMIDAELAALHRLGYPDPYKKRLEEGTA